MDAKTEKALNNLARLRRIKEILDRKFGDMLGESVGEWPYYRPPLPHDFPKSFGKGIVSRWKSYIVGLGMKMVTEKGMERASRSPSHEIHVRDPAAGWRDSVFGGVPAYIRIPEEVAKKILVLGDLP